MQLKVGACSVNSEFANAVTSSGVVPAVARASVRSVALLFPNSKLTFYETHSRRVFLRA
jgi:hypothetical protein